MGSVWRTSDKRDERIVDMNVSDRENEEVGTDERMDENEGHQVLEMTHVRERVTWRRWPTLEVMLDFGGGGGRRERGGKCRSHSFDWFLARMGNKGLFEIAFQNKSLT